MSLQREYVPQHRGCGKDRSELFSLKFTEGRAHVIAGVRRQLVVFRGEVYDDQPVVLTRGEHAVVTVASLRGTDRGRELILRAVQLTWAQSINQRVSSPPM